MLILNFYSEKRLILPFSYRSEGRQSHTNRKQEWPLGKIPMNCFSPNHGIVMHGQNQAETESSSPLVSWWDRTWSCNAEGGGEITQRSSSSWVTINWESAVQNHFSVNYTQSLCGVSSTCFLSLLGKHPYALWRRYFTRDVIVSQLYLP